MTERWRTDDGGPQEDVDLREQSPGAAIRDAGGPARARPAPSLEYLRRRSLERMWWESARVALRRGQSGDVEDAQIKAGSRR